MLEKALLWDEDRNQIEHRTGFLQFYVKTKKVCRRFASFSSEQEHFTHDMYMTKGWAKGCGGLGGEDLEWGRGKCASLYTGSSFGGLGMFQ